MLLGMGKLVWLRFKSIGKWQIEKVDSRYNSVGLASFLGETEKKPRTTNIEVQVLIVPS